MHLLRLFQHLSIISRTIESDNSPYHLFLSSNALPKSKLFGYTHDEDGKLIINEEQAPTVRLMFFMYLYGYNCQQIADTVRK